jgi:hypothetical protein
MRVLPLSHLRLPFGKSINSPLLIEFFSIDWHMSYLKAFVAGFVSTLVFHQGLLCLLYMGGFSPRAPWNMAAVPPFHIPAVISLAFWGGVWGIVLWTLIRNSRGGPYWVWALVVGALGASLVAWFVVMPIKGMGPAGGWDVKVIVGGLLLNGAWGLGAALLMRLMNQSQSSTEKS